MRDQTRWLWEKVRNALDRETLMRRASDALDQFMGADPVGEVRSAEVSDWWRRIRNHLWLVVIFSAAINILYLSPSLFMLQVYDRVLPSSGVLTLIFLGAVLVAALGVMSFLDAARAKVLSRASLRLERLAAEPIMREMMSARREAASTSTIAGLRDLDALRQGLSSPAAIGLVDLPWAPLFIFVCFLIHFWIGMLALFGALLILGLAILNERALRTALSSMALRANQVHTAHEQDLSSAESGHALGLADPLIRRRLLAREDLINAQMDTAITTANYSASTKFVRQLLQSLSLGLAAYLAIKREISPGAIIACSILTARAYAPVEQIVGGWRQLGLAYAAHRNLLRLLAGLKDKTARTPLPVPKGNLRVEGVYAMPPGGTTPAISNVSFIASPGEIVAIIGHSGAGKTTLARVLANAAQPRAGTIRIDGAKYADWDPSALSRHVGYLPQKIDLYDGTVAENIARFAQDDDDADLQTIGDKAVAAATLAGAHTMILSLPQGYDTKLGPGGAGLSLGQAQRIALARALYGSPAVVVLDEPNAHLDSEGDSALSNALLQCRARGVLCFVVAHRSAVVDIADRIIALSRGQLVANGPKNEVLAQISPPLRSPQVAQPSVSAAE